MKSEILAPAGSLNALKVAINSGADAVYLGASKFNARAGATNFTLDELKMGVEYAHIFGSKVYLTVNTIIKNEEIQEVLELIEQCVNIGVDAFIVQDMGLVRCLLNNYENIELHASTQMAVHNAYGAKILEDIGFKRVVLSRECSIEDIKEIRKNTNLEIEYFVHGALCVSFSGNCYLSSLCTGCSGNRGKCKQYCRLPLTAEVDNKQIKSGYLLSPSDQCLIERMQQLQEAGVTSFKIEGRLKKESYIASAVQAYKKALAKKDFKSDINLMKQIFSRGEFNTGKYCDMKNDNIINTTFNNHCGIRIGRVESVNKFKDIFKIGLNCSHNLVKGDALKFFTNQTEICSMGVGNVEKNGTIQYVYSKNKPQINSDVHLIVNKKLEDEVIPAERKLKIEMQFVGFAGAVATLTLRHKELKVTVKSEHVLESAKNVAVTEQDIKNSLLKLNETAFEVEKFSTKFNDIFIAKSQLNALRREGVQELINLILENNKPKVELKNKVLENIEIKNNHSYEIVDEIADIKNNGKAIIFAPSTYSKNIIEQAVKTAKSENVKLFLDLPNIARTNDLNVINNILSCFTKSDFGIVANNLYAFQYVNRFEIIAGLGLNIINEQAKNFYLNLGAKDCVFSIESNIKDVSKNAVLYSFGQPVVMTLTHCPIKMLCNNTCSNCQFHKNIKYKFSNGKEFYIRRKIVANCYFELVSCECISLNNANFRTISDRRLKNVTTNILGLSNKEI